MFRIIDKRGHTDIKDVVLFTLIFVIIGIVIGGSINLFYGHQIDTRSLEAKILNEKISRGIFENGLGNLESFDIYSVAEIDRMVINNDKFYFKIDFFKDGEKLRESIFDGNREFEANCGLPGKKLPKGYKKSIIVEGTRVEIMTCSNYLGGRV